MEEIITIYFNGMFGLRGNKEDIYKALTEVRRMIENEEDYLQLMEAGSFQIVREMIKIKDK